MKRKKRVKRLKKKHIEFAASREMEKYLPSIVGLSNEEAFDVLWQWFDDRKFWIIEAERKGAITFKWMAVFPALFFKLAKSSLVKLAWTVHECWHAIQWIVLGWLRFAWRYRNPRWRWALEVQAESAAIRELVVRGASPRYLRLRCEREAQKISSAKGTYKLKRLDRQQAYKEALRLYLAAAEVKPERA